MTLPNFLIIGAMKAGTTSLYRDLLTHPAVFLPQDKEPESLADDRIFSPEGREEYERLFASARQRHTCIGEASTAYTKRPDYEGCAERARRLLGSDVRIIYLVREPIARIMSHFRHNRAIGAIPEHDVNEAVRNHPELLNWTRYAMQVTPWLEQFGDDNVCIIQFERYTADRRACVVELCKWFGIEPMPEKIDVEAVYNKSEGKPILTGGWRRIGRSSVYRSWLRPFMPIGLRERIRKAVLPKATVEPVKLTPETESWIRNELREDHESLRVLMNREQAVWG